MPLKPLNMRQSPRHYQLRPIVPTPSFFLSRTSLSLHSLHLLLKLTACGHLTLQRLLHVMQAPLQRLYQGPISLMLTLQPRIHGTHGGRDQCPQYHPGERPGLRR